VRKRLARALLAALLAAPACGLPAHLRYEEKLDQTPAPARHAVHSERLQGLMRALERLTSERLPQAMNLEVARQRQAAEIASVARAMAATAREIPVATAGIELDAAEREDFDRAAALLFERSERLGRDGAVLSPAALRAEVDAIDASCQGCHRQFQSRDGRAR